MAQRCPGASAARPRATRRAVGSAGLGAALGAALLGGAAPSASAPAADYGAFVSVKAALKPAQYVAAIDGKLAPSFAALADLVADGKYKLATEALLLAPVDDLKQSLFYLPWAVLEAGDDTASAALQERYVEVRAALQEFDRVCLEAARYQLDDEDVEKALADLRKAVDAEVAVAHRLPY